jgi:thioredoxin reductase
VLLATGLTDDVPTIEGFADCYGISVHHCLYCDGYEHRDMPLAAYGHGEKAVGLAAMLRQWSDDVVLLSDGSIDAGDAATAGRLRTLGIEWRPEPVDALDHEGGRLRQVRFASGERLPRLALFFSTGCRQTSSLPEALGCARDDKGSIVADPGTEESSVPGVFVAGDASRDTLLVAVAIGEAAKAAVAINRALLKEDGLLS